jgi:hypothetical protein
VRSRSARVSFVTPLVQQENGRTVHRTSLDVAHIEESCGRLEVRRHPETRIARGASTHLVQPKVVTPPRVFQRRDLGSTLEAPSDRSIGATYGGPFHRASDRMSLWPA